MNIEAKIRLAKRYGSNAWKFGITLDATLDNKYVELVEGLTDARLLYELETSWRLGWLIAEEQEKQDL